MRLSAIRQFARLSLLALIVVGLAAGGFALRTIRVPYASTEQREFNRNVGELRDGREVGQTFESVRPYFSGVGFQVATYGGRENTQDVIFELRGRVEEQTPLRSQMVNARVFRDHQRYVFTFESIRDSAGKTYYASLRSPSSAPGNAITVDYSNVNPYRKGAASTMVVLSAPREEHGNLRGTVKPDADTTFAAYHRVTAWEYLRITLIERTREGIRTVREHPGESKVNAEFGIIALALALAVTGLQRIGRGVLLRPAVLPVVFGVLVLLGLGLRLLYVGKLPYTNDEGSYLYDARTILEGHLPGGDGLAKAPVVVAAFAAGITLFGNTLTAARSVSVVAGLLTAVPLAVLGYALGRSRDDRRAAWHTGLLTAAVWLLAGAPAIFHAYGHTQPLQVFLATAGLAAVVIALRRRRMRWLLFAGILLGLGVAARKSTLALGVPVAVLLLAEPLAWRMRVLYVVALGSAFLVAVAIFLGMVFALYGGTGVRYATGIDLAKTSLEQLDTRGDLYATYSVKGVLPFFRESLPLLFLAFVMLGRESERILHRVRPHLARLGWLVPLFLAWRGGQFLRTYEESIHFSYGVWPFWMVMTLFLVLLALVPLRTSARSAGGERDRPSTAVLFPVSWFLGVGLFYAFWIKFHANYLLEFLPAVALLAALGAQWLSRAPARQWMVRWGLVAFVTWGAMASSVSGYHFEHTGTFHWTSIQEAADVLRAKVPLTDLVLTGAVIVPYLSGHHVPYNVAHPTWYGYGFIEPELRNVFTAPHEQLVATVARDVNWAVVERLTVFSYLNEYPDIARTLDGFAPVAGIENLSNPMTILKRQ